MLSEENCKIACLVIVPKKRVPCIFVCFFTTLYFSYKMLGVQDKNYNFPELKKYPIVPRLVHYEKERESKRFNTGKLI